MVVFKILAKYTESGPSPKIYQVRISGKRVGVGSWNLHFNQLSLMLICVWNWMPRDCCCRLFYRITSIQFCSVAQPHLTLCNPMDCSIPGLPVHHQHLEFTQTHVHWVHDAIQPSYPLSSPSPPAFNLSQHQGLFKWVSSSHQVAKVLEFQLQPQSFQWTARTDLL